MTAAQPLTLAMVMAERGASGANIAMPRTSDSQPPQG
jgi:hypothetical protein